MTELDIIHQIYDENSLKMIGERLGILEISLNSLEDISKIEQISTEMFREFLKKSEEKSYLSLILFINLKFALRKKTNANSQLDSVLLISKIVLYINTYPYSDMNNGLLSLIKMNLIGLDEFEFVKNNSDLYSRFKKDKLIISDSTFRERINKVLNFKQKAYQMSELNISNLVLSREIDKFISEIRDIYNIL